MTLSIHDLLVDVLGYTEGERTSISIIPTGGGAFRTVALATAAEAQGVLDANPGANLFFGVNPVNSGVELPSRGDSADVTRLAALVVDIDVKDGGVADMSGARNLVSTIAELIGSQPSAITRSGHGLHGYWPVEDGQIDDANRARVRLVMARFRSLVRKAGGDTVPDSVFDLARVLRAPGTVNSKDAADPRDVVTEPAPGRPLTLDEVEERLDELGIVAEAGPTTNTGVVVSNPAEWAYAPTTHCDYAQKVLKSWETDSPDRGGRHGWLADRAVRLAAMCRRGCLTEQQHGKAVRLLHDRFAQFCAGGIGGKPRAVTYPTDANPRSGDIGSFNWGKEHVSTMTDDEVAAQLGNHHHITELVAGLPVELDSSLLDNAFADNDNAADHNVADDNVADDDDDDNDDDDGAQSIPMGAIPRTDDGAAQLVVKAWRGRLMYAPDLHRWLQWDGTRWVQHADDSPGHVAVRSVIRAIKPGADASMAKWIRQLQSSGRISGIAGLVRRDPAIHTNADELDSDGWILNSPSGIIELRTGAIRPADPSARCTQITGVPVDFDAASRAWDAFLLQTFGDEDMVDYAQRLAGMSAIGVQLDQVLPFLSGEGANGKSVFLQVLVAVLGSYAAVMPAGFLELTRSEKHETEIARLRGIRLAVASEVKPGSSWDEQRMKSLSGDGRLIGRLMRGDFFEFANQLSMWVAGNHEPAVKAGGPSFWRRLLKLPFDHVVPEDQRIRDLSSKLVAAEGPAILAWIVRGALAYQRDGLITPQRVVDATAEYARSEDHVGRFVEDCLIIGGGDECRQPPSQIYSAYLNWCRDHNEDEMSERALLRELKIRFQVGLSRTGSQRLRNNVSIKPYEDYATSAEEFLA